jgi:AMP deaminase
MRIEMENGMFRVYERNDEQQWIPMDYPRIDRQQFIADHGLLSAMINDGPLISFCYRRLQYLQSKFQLHCLLNEVKEWASIRSTSHRDFYNVRKVDTHIHAASSMNHKHLLRFMKKKLKTSGDMFVYKTNDGQRMTLKQVFDELKITAYDLTVDMLGVHAVSVNRILHHLKYDHCLFNRRIDIRFNVSIYSIENTIHSGKVHYGTC